MLPLKWLTQGMRSVFLPEGAAIAEAGGELGARNDCPGPGRMGDHRRRGLRPHVPVAAQRGMTRLRRWSAVLLPMPGRGTAARR